MLLFIQRFLCSPYSHIQIYLFLEISVESKKACETEKDIHSIPVELAVCIEGDRQESVGQRLV